MFVSKNINNYFDEKLRPLNCDEKTKAYIVSIFSKYKKQENDFSKESITILYSKAKFDQDFFMFQNIGDWLFFCSSLFPESLNGASQEYFITVAQLSYYSCYKLINKKWIIYENLADDFYYLTKESRKAILEF